MRCPALSELPPPPHDREGWPWTEETPRLPETMPGGQAWPRVSIVTPSYNQGRFIEETIRSVLLQGYPDLEYMVIDGGSTDSTVDIIKRYEKWLTYWVSEPDRGQSHAINKGWRMATGEIYAYLNSDDTYVPGAVEAAVEHVLANPDVVMVYGEGDIVDECGKVTEHCRTGDLNLKRLLCSYNHVPQPTVFFKRSVTNVLGYLDEDLHLAMDLDYWIRLSLRFGTAYIPQTLARMRFHPSAKIPTQYHKAVYEHLRILDKFYSDENLRGDLKAFRRYAYGAVHLRASADFHRAKQKTKAYKHLVKGIISYPKCLVDLETIVYAVRLTLGERATRVLMNLARRSGIARVLRGLWL